MREFLMENKPALLLLLLLVAIIVYDFLFLSKEKAALIVYKHVSGVDWDAGYLKARARAIKGKKSSFLFKNINYDTETGKRIV